MLLKVKDSPKNRTIPFLMVFLWATQRVSQSIITPNLMFFSYKSWSLVTSFRSVSTSSCYYVTNIIILKYQNIIYYFDRNIRIKKRTNKKKR